MNYLYVLSIGMMLFGLGLLLAFAYDIIINPRVCTSYETKCWDSYLTTTLIPTGKSIIPVVSTHKRYVDCDTDDYEYTGEECVSYTRVSDLK